MCGVIGIYENKVVVSNIYSAMLKIQHKETSIEVINKLEYKKAGV